MQIFSTTDTGLFLECFFGARYDEHVRARRRAEWLREAKADGGRGFAAVIAELQKMREERA